MKTRILYFSKGGNTAKIADVISSAVSAKCEQVPPAYPCENEKILFVGTGIYGGKPDKKMIDFCNSLEVSRAKNVAFFVTSGSGEHDAGILMDIVKQKGINVIPDTFRCKGKFFLFLNMGKPGKQDLDAAAQWAKKIVEKLSEQ